jgi:hypothetical protein
VITAVRLSDRERKFRDLTTVLFIMQRYMLSVTDDDHGRLLLVATRDAETHHFNSFEAARQWLDANQEPHKESYD